MMKMGSGGVSEMEVPEVETDTHKARREGYISLLHCLSVVALPPLLLSGST